MLERNLNIMYKNQYNKYNTLIQFGNNLWKHISSVKLTFIVC